MFSLEQKELSHGGRRAVSKHFAFSRRVARDVEMQENTMEEKSFD
jgi:hypothetical protein